MHQMTVYELLSIVVKEKPISNYYYEYLDFFRGNEHVSNPLNNDPEVHYFRGREEGKFLTGDEIVYGNYLLFEESSHDYFAAVYQYSSLLEIQKHLIGGGSYTNGFTANSVVIVDGKTKPFVIKGYDKNANEYTHVKFENDDLFELELDRQWVEWLDEERELSEYEKEIQCCSPLDLVMIRYKYSSEKEEIATFIQNLNPYDQEKFLNELDRELNEKIKVTEEFKQRLRKQPES